MVYYGSSTSITCRSSSDSAHLVITAATTRMCTAAACSSLLLVPHWNDSSWPCYINTTIQFFWVQVQAISIVCGTATWLLQLQLQLQLPVTTTTRAIAAKLWLLQEQPLLPLTAPLLLLLPLATCHCHNYSHSELPVLLLAKKLLTMVVILPQPQPPLCGLLPPATPQQYDCYHHLSHSSYHYHWSLVLLSACMLPQEPHHLSFLLLPLPFLPLPALPSSKQCPLPALARSWRGLGGPWQGLPGDRGVPYPYMLEY